MISGVYGCIYQPKKRKPSYKKKGKKRARVKRERVPYAEYLQSPYWQKVRQAKLTQAGRRCQACGATGRLEVHHKTYRNRGRELQHLGDLSVYCRKCHGRVHGHAT